MVSSNTIYFMPIVKWFPVLLSNTNNSIYNEFACWLISYLPTVKWFQVFLYNTNNSINGNYARMP